MALDTSVWSDAHVAQAFHDVFIPLRVQGRDVFMGKYPEIKKIVGSKPTYMVILDSNKKTLARAQRAPFADAEEALEWVAEMSAALDENVANEEALVDQPDNVELMEALASNYYVLGQHENFQNVAEKLLPHLEGEAAIVLELRMVEVSMDLEMAVALDDPTSWTAPEKVFPKTRALTTKLANKLIDAEDDRVFDLLFDPNSKILLMTMRDNPLELGKRVFETFPGHERAGESLLQLSLVAIMGGSKEVKAGIQKLMEDYVANADEDDPQLEDVKTMLESLKAFGKGLGGMLKPATQDEPDESGDDSDDSENQPTERSSDDF